MSAGNSNQADQGAGSSQYLGAFNPSFSNLNNTPVNKNILIGAGVVVLVALILRKRK